MWTKHKKNEIKEYETTEINNIEGIGMKVNILKFNG